MQIASLALTLAALIAPAPAHSPRPDTEAVRPFTAERPAPVAPRSSPQAAAQAGGPTAVQAAGPASARRRFGIGANMAATIRGAGGTVRYWLADRVGLDLSASWYRPYSRRQTTDRTSTLLIAPSAIYMLTGFDETKDVNLRPYAGGGVNYARTSVPIDSSPTVRERARGTGGQVFGGAELTFKDAPELSINMELVRYWVPEPFGSGISSLHGTHFVGAIYFYF